MNLQQFGQRLEIVRSKLELTQDVMAKKLDVSKRSYCAYEAGETAPSAKLLAALANMGVDISYILTGHHSQPAKELDLRPDEAALLDNYRNSPKDQQDILKATSAAFAQQGVNKKASG